MLSNVEGKELVRLARNTIGNYLKTGEFFLTETRFNQKRGVFVSIHTYPDHKLRGCVGYPHGVLLLDEALQRSSISAAFYDSRFLPLTKDELEKVVFEVSVLTEPVLIKVKNPREYLKKIEIGRDGLILEYGFLKGVLLPQVPLQFKPRWDVQTFLEHTCMKAGLTTDMWLDSKTKIYKFQAQIFKEETPNGKVIQTSH